MVREGLKALLEREGFQVVGEAANGMEAVAICQEQQPDVALLDLLMPRLNGVEAAREILQRGSRTKVVLLTMYSDDHYVLEALGAGITGYVLKTKAASSLVEAIEEVAAGNVYLSPGISRSVVDAYLGKSFPADPLSPRERQALQLIAEGLSTKEIADLMGISPKTAESHRARIMEKLKIHDTAGLVRYAIRRGIIKP